MDKEVDLYNALEKGTDISKCPTCGANLIFNPEKQVLGCEYCGTEKTITENKSEELNLEKLFSETVNSWSNETHVFRCNNCGAKEVLTKENISLSCSFCGTTNVVETEELAGLMPNAVIPFKITQEYASNKVITWARKKYFAPKAFRKSATPEEMKGIYNPTFTYDTFTVSHYSGRLGKYRTYTQRVNGKTVTKRKLEYFKIHGSIEYEFDDVLIQASSNIDQKYIDKMQPFDTNNSNVYSKEYLHGYNANHYTKDGITCWNNAKDVIKNRLRAAILSRYTYDVVDRFHCDTTHHNITYKYLLLPIYVGHCNWHRRLYNFYVNGINGKVTGKTPVSAIKVLIVTVLAILLISLLYWYFVYNNEVNLHDYIGMEG